MNSSRISFILLECKTLTVNELSPLTLSRIHCVQEGLANMSTVLAISRRHPLIVVT